MADRPKSSRTQDVQGARMKVVRRSRRQSPCRKPVSWCAWLTVLLSTFSLRTEGLSVCPDGGQKAEDTLAGPQISELSFRHSDKVAAAAILRKLALGVFSPDVVQGDGGTDSHREQNLSSTAWTKDKCHLLRSIGRATDTARCAWDSSLEESLSALEGRKYLLAAQFNDNPALLPHLFVQLWHTLALLPLGGSFVSMYHNGSSAETGKLLLKFGELFTAMGVPYKIISENGAGNVTLEFARNAAMKPLRQLRAGKGRSALHTDSKPHFAADYIALVEHGFPCASDIIRLLLSKADLACGLDFQTHEDGKNMVLHDISAVRDIGGEIFERNPPYVVDPHSAKRLRDGLPIHVRCCWSGLTVLKTLPFSKKLHFRRHKPGECRGSQAALLCKDLMHLGFSNFTVDPGVRQALSIREADDLRREGMVREMKATNWLEVSVARPFNSSLATWRPYSMCCPPNSEGQSDLATCAWEYIEPIKKGRFNVSLNVKVT